MYSFDMTAEQKMLVETVHRFAEKNLRPSIARQKKPKPPQKVVQMGWELGLLPGSIEAEYGGFGEYSALTSALYLEELGWGDVGISLHLLTPNLFAMPDWPSLAAKSRRSSISRPVLRRAVPQGDCGPGRAGGAV